MRWRRGLIPASILVLITGAGLAITAWQAPDPFIAEAVMPDGLHRVRLMAMMPEGPLDYEWEDPRSGFFWRLFSTPNDPLLKFEPVHLDGRDELGHPGPSFVFRTVDAAGQYKQCNVEIEFEESTGFRFRGENLWSVSASTFSTKAFTATALPRRDRTLRIGIYKRGETRTSLPAIIEIPNPMYRESFPEWTAEELPAVKQMNAHTVILDGLEKPDGSKEYYPQHHIEGPPLSDKPVGLEVLEDATGNHGNPLSPFEPVWKVKLEFEPDASGAFTAEEIHAIHPSFAPTVGKADFLDAPDIVKALSAESIVLSGPGRIRFQDGDVSSISAETHGKDGAPSKDPTQIVDIPRSGGASSENRMRIVNGREAHGFEIEVHEPFLCIRYPVGAQPKMPLVRLKASDKAHPALVGAISENGQLHLIAHWPIWPDDPNIVIELIESKPMEVDFYVKPPEESRADYAGRSLKREQVE